MAVGALVPVVARALVRVVAPVILRAKHARAPAAHDQAVRADAADIARVAALQRPHLGRGAPAGGDAGARARLLAAAAADIRSDAGGEAPVLRVDCEPFPSGGGRYECLAVTADVPATARTPAGAKGLAYRVLVDFAGGRYGYCRLAPRAVKVQRAPVPLSPLCGGEVKGQHG
jgi:hypothetical protein